MRYIASRITPQVIYVTYALTLALLFLAGFYPPAQQPDLSGVQHLVMGAPDHRQQLGFRKVMRMRDGLIQFIFVQATHFP